MGRLEEKIANYGAYHRNKNNKLTHFIGVPLVMLSLFIASGWFRLVHSATPISLGMVLFVFLVIYYLLQDLKIGGITALVTLPLLILGEVIAQFNFPRSVLVFVCVFILGWSFQLLGHFFEGKRPALLDNLSQAFVAPLFLVWEVMHHRSNR